MQAAGDGLAAGIKDEVFDVEKQILAGAVVSDPAHVVERNAIEGLADPVRIVAGNDALRREHHQMSIVDGHQRRQKQLLGVFEVLIEDVGHIFRRKRHRSKYMICPTV